MQNYPSKPQSMLLPLTFKFDKTHNNIKTFKTNESKT